MTAGLSPLSVAILRLLGYGPKHPYEMQQLIKTHEIDRIVKVTHGSLYHAVDRLARSGLITAVETSRAGRRPERTVYALTPAGEDAAHTRLREMLTSVNPEYPTFRVALAFMTFLSPAEAHEALSRHCIELEALLAGAQTAYDLLRKQGLPRVHLVEVEHMTATTRAELDLARGLADDIDSGELTWSAGEHEPDSSHGEADT